MTNAMPPIRNAEEVEQWLVQQLGERLQEDPATIDRDASLISLGLDSMQYVVIVGELEDWLGCRFASNPLEHYRTIRALSAFIARELDAGQTTLNPAHEIPHS